MILDHLHLILFKNITPKSKLNQSKKSTRVEDVKAIEEPDSKLKF